MSSWNAAFFIFSFFRIVIEDDGANLTNLKEKQKSVRIKSKLNNNKIESKVLKSMYTNNIITQTI